MLELSLLSANLIPHCSWKTVRESWGNDHLPIKIEIFGSAQCRTRYPRLYNFKPDWKVVKDNLHKETETCCNKLSNSNDVIDKYSTFIATISKCITDATPNSIRTNYVSNYPGKNKRQAK